MRARAAVILSVAVFGLAGCEDGVRLGGAASTEEGTAASPLATERRAGVRDVERPDVFKVTDEALWDGRPSLGGVWIAHPDVTTPERAIFINEATGQRIAGALFRRERENPGPKFQLSSDAAAGLNILAGQPTQVTVIAVRPEEIEVEPETPVISDEQVGAAPEAARVDDSGEAAAAGAAAGAAATEARPRRGNFLQRIFGGNRTPRAQPGADAGTAGSAAAPEVETQPLDPVASSAAAAIARAEADDKPAARPARSPAPAAAPAPAEAPTPAPAPSAGAGGSFIQVGLFSVEANAVSAADKLRGAGIVPSVVESSSGGELAWRVVVGPVNEAGDRTALLAQVKRLGFDDAFLTSN